MRTAGLRAAALLLACCLLPVWGAEAASQATGSISGLVTDQTGAVLPGVTVELRAEGRPVRTEVTDATGRYAFASVTPGPVAVAFRLINYVGVRQAVSVPPGQAVALDVMLYLSLAADITVTGSRTFRNLAELEPVPDNLVGLAAAASQGAITARQIEARPIQTAGEVLETVPGLISSQHSGEGKANQYYLRGFNLDHGTDFATTVAGVPVNLPTHGHGQGYTDLNFLIPELVSSVQFRKGPYFAEDGDFSAAGSSQINYINALAAPIARVGGGQDAWGRVLGAASPRLGDGVLLGALELDRNDGPWVRPDRYRRVNGVLRYSRGDTRNGVSLTAMGYSATWDATDQIPVRAVRSGLISRLEGLDPTLGGATGRYTLSADVQRSRGGSVTRASAYLQRYRLNLFSNFTYYLDDPVRGDQFEQADRRWVSGGRIAHRRLSRWAGRAVESAVGIQIRHDAIGDVGLFSTQARRRLSVTRQDRVQQTSAAVYGEAEIEWTPHMRTLLGLRGDVYQFDVTSNEPRNSGEAADGLLSPKASVIFGPWDGTELYVNTGAGFHSNDARGATITVDPVTADPVDAVTPLARARGAEVGVRTVRIPGVQSTVTVWTLGIESELLFAGDAGATEASRPGRRSGVEWTNYVRLRPWLTLDADLSFSRARFTNDDPAGNRIPGAVGRVVAIGVTVAERRRVSGSVRLRYFGPRPLVEDGSVRSEATTLVNLQVGSRLSSRTRLLFDVFNLFNAAQSDIDYFYVSRLPGEEPDGVADMHFHPATTRTARVNLVVEF